MKINVLRVILIIMLLGIFSVIFNFSSQNGETSGNLSMEITKNVTKNINQIQKLEETKKEKVISRIEKIIRKMAHFSLYTVVGILLMSLMCTYKLSEVKRVGTSLVVGILYAISDEIHQKFISERSSQITDVMIDTFGVILGILLVMLALKIWKKIKTKNSTKSVEIFK